MWLGGWEGGEGVAAAVVGCSWQSGDNQQPDLLCLTSLSPCPPHFSTQLYDALLNSAVALISNE